jgi:hypothetical protein
VQERIILNINAHIPKICFHAPAHESTVSVDSVTPASRIRVSDMLLLLTVRNQNTAFG